MCFITLTKKPLCSFPTGFSAHFPERIPAGILWREQLYAGIMSYRNYNQVYLKHTVPAGLLGRIDVKLCRSCKLSSARYLQEKYLHKETMYFHKWFIEIVKAEGSRVQFTAKRWHLLHFPTKRKDALLFKNMVCVCGPGIPNDMSPQV